MAHSRPTARSHNSASLHQSPPSKSPARHSHHERPGHQRRKSGQFVVTERKSSRPAPLNRRTTPQFVTKVGSGLNGGKNMGKSGRDSRHFEDEDFPLSGEGFLQYCASCEKQINPHDSFSTLYCSEDCRKQDLQPASTSSYNSTYNSYASQPQYSPPMSPYTRYSNYETYDLGPDIIPQLSPTQATRRSYFNSAPIPPRSTSPPSPTTNYSPKSSTATSKTVKRHSGSSTALASLRELAVALPNTRDRDSRRNSRDKDRKREYSPSTSTSASISSPPTPLSNSSTGVWNYLPRTLSMASVYSRDIVSASQAGRYPGTTASPGNSYTSYGDYQYAAVKPAGLLPPISLGMDRPLPPRVYGGRPRSVDLVTPISYTES